MSNKSRLKTFALASFAMLIAALVFNMQLSAQNNPEEKKMKEEPLPFDPEQSMKYLKEICDIGTRISGSEGIVKQRILIKKHFEALGAKVLEQEFKAIQKSTGRPTPMVNMIISWHPTIRERVILCSHFDTRPFADQETDPKKRKGTFISANDGASGVALLMEMGRHMKKLNCNIGVDFVFLMAKNLYSIQMMNTFSVRNILPGKPAKIPRRLNIVLRSYLIWLQEKMLNSRSNKTLGGKQAQWFAKSGPPPTNLKSNPSNSTNSAGLQLMMITQL